MSKVLKIHNQGLLDIDQLIYMGCSTKNGETTIGKFGTGLKFALAVLLKNDIKFQIFIGGREIKITKQNKTIKGKTFEKIIVDGIETSYLTDLGKTWEIWQGLREFIANAIDEQGHYCIVDEDNVHLNNANETLILFNYDQIKEEMDNFDFGNWIETSDGLFYKEINGERRRARVFKEGFLVYEAEDDSSFDYRIDSIELNDARVALDRWAVKRGIAQIQAEMEQPDIETIIENDETELAIYYDNDSLGENWTSLSDAVMKKMKSNGSGYQLSEAIKYNIKASKNEAQTQLVFGDYTFVSESNLKSYKGVDYYLQENCLYDWDVSVSSGKFYVGNEDTKVLDKMVEYEEALQYKIDNDLTTVVDTILHFNAILKAK